MAQEEGSGSDFLQQQLARLSPCGPRPLAHVGVEEHSSQRLLLSGICLHVEREGNDLPLHLL